MDASRRQFGLVNVGGSPRGAGRVIIAAVILIALALIKPWGAQAPGQGRTVVNPDGPEAAAAASPSQHPALPNPSLGPDEIACLHGLEIVSLVRLSAWNIREWLPIVPTEASGPDDPRMTFAALDGGPVRAIGVCNEGGDMDVGSGQAIAGHPAVVGAWLVSKHSRAPTAIRLTELKPLSHGVRTEDRLAHLYRPLKGYQQGTWPVGRYVLEVAVTDTPSEVDRLWVGVEVGDVALASR
jgi:hypothetical protein